MANKKKSKKKNTKLAIFGVLAVAVVLGLAGAEMYRYLGPNGTYTDIRAYLQLNSDNEWALLCNTSRGSNALESGDELYIPVSSLNELVDSVFYYDPSVNALICVLPEGKYILKAGEGQLMSQGGDQYLALSFIREHYACDIKINDKEKIIWIWNDYSNAYTFAFGGGHSSVLRVAANIRAEIVKDSLEGQYICLEGEGKFTLVIDEQGSIGYIKTEDLSADRELTAREYSGNLSSTYDNLRDSAKVLLGWHMMDEYNYTDQIATAESFLASETGLTVVSPTWYSVKNENVEMTDFSDKAYVQMAHEKGLKVWGLVDNFSSDLDNLALLSSCDHRTALIEKLVNSALSCGMDGINIDFEMTTAKVALNADCGPAYVEFLRELAYECHKKGLSVSVDVPVPYSYNSYYNVSALGQFMDYVIVMGYDEHYAGSAEAGSVASYDFVNNGIVNTLKQTSAEAVIWAVPFYTRVWTVDENNAVVGSRERGIKKLSEELLEMGVTGVWHEKERQNFATYQGEKGTVKIWLEDAQSMGWKAELIKNADFAGVAAWRLGIETDEVWQVFSNIFN